MVKTDFVVQVESGIIDVLILMAVLLDVTKEKRVFLKKIFLVVKADGCRGSVFVSLFCGFLGDGLYVGFSFSGWILLTADGSHDVCI